MKAFDNSEFEKYNLEAEFICDAIKVFCCE